MRLLLAELSRPRVTHNACGFNLSMQHLDSNRRAEDVAYEVPDEDSVHRGRQGVYGARRETVRRRPQDRNSARTFQALLRRGGLTSMTRSLVRNPALGLNLSLEVRSRPEAATHASEQKLSDSRRFRLPSLLLGVRLQLRRELRLQDQSSVVGANPTSPPID